MWPLFKSLCLRAGSQKKPYMSHPRLLHDLSYIMVLIVPMAVADMDPAALTVACVTTTGATAMKRAVHVMNESAHTRSRGWIYLRPRTKLTLSVSVPGVVYAIAGRVTARVFQDMGGKVASAAHALMAAVGMAHVNSFPNCATTWVTTSSGAWFSV